MIVVGPAQIMVERDMKFLKRFQDIFPNLILTNSCCAKSTAVADPAKSCGTPLYVR
jgi:hypothetical protein